MDCCPALLACGSVADLRRCQALRRRHVVFLPRGRMATLQKAKTALTSVWCKIERLTTRFRHVGASLAKEARQAHLKELRNTLSPAKGDANRQGNRQPPPSGMGEAAATRGTASRRTQPEGTQHNFVQTGETLLSPGRGIVTLRAHNSPLQDTTLDAVQHSNSYSNPPEPIPTPATTQGERVQALQNIADTARPVMEREVSPHALILRGAVLPHRHVHRLLCYEGVQLDWQLVKWHRMGGSLGPVRSLCRTGRQAPVATGAETIKKGGQGQTRKLRSALMTQHKGEVNQRGTEALPLAGCSRTWSCSRKLK